MKKILTSRQMKKCDMLTIFRGTPSVTLMERAARSVFDNIMDSGFCLDKVLVVCGSGNNGGDGLLVAKYLYEADVPCNVWYVGEGHTIRYRERRLHKGIFPVTYGMSVKGIPCPKKRRSFTLSFPRLK